MEAEFMLATRATQEEARILLRLCAGDCKEAVQLFCQLQPRHFIDGFPEEWITPISQFPLDVRARILNKFVPLFPREHFQTFAEELDGTDRYYLSVIALRAFANSRFALEADPTLANLREEFAQIFHLCKTSVLPLFQELRNKPTNSYSPPSIFLEKFKVLVQEKLPRLAASNARFRGILDDVANLRVCCERRLTMFHVAASYDDDTDLFNTLLASSNVKFDLKDDCHNTALHLGVNYPNKVKTLCVFLEQHVLEMIDSRFANVQEKMRRLAQRAASEKKCALESGIMPEAALMVFKREEVEYAAANYGLFAIPYAAHEIGKKATRNVGDRALVFLVGGACKERRVIKRRLGNELEGKRSIQ